MQSGFFKLNFKDVSKGLVVAVLAVVLGALQQMMTAHGLDFGAYDWNSIINLAITAGGAYLVKNLFSTPDGKVLGRI